MQELKSKGIASIFTLVSTRLEMTAVAGDKEGAVEPSCWSQAYHARTASKVHGNNGKVSYQL
jgi:hypothetical protein